MLTADLADVRRKNGELFMRVLDAHARTELCELAEQYIDAARAHVGCRREELYAAWDAIGHDAKHPRRAAALRKLVDDACVFEAEATVEPMLVRRTVFTLASEQRSASERTLPIDRQEIVAQAACELGMTSETVESALFADLRGEHLLMTPPVSNAESIAGDYELAQAQAILLRAVRVTCEVRAASPGLFRAFFARLKFHKLLFSVERMAPQDHFQVDASSRRSARSGPDSNCTESTKWTEYSESDGAKRSEQPASALRTAPEPPTKKSRQIESGQGFRVVVDGPFSMFDSVSRYGVRFALLLPTLRALDAWSLTADVRWGKTREPLVFRLSSNDLPTSGVDEDSRVHLADDVRALLEDLRATSTHFAAKPATALLDVPGLGVCIPDLVLRDKRGGPPVYVEVLGFWSRDAVFRRIELAQRGLGARIVFAVSARLRVSAELLDDSSSSALYVYKGKMSARALLAHVERVAAR